MTPSTSIFLALILAVAPLAASPPGRAAEVETHDPHDAHDPQPARVSAKPQCITSAESREEIKTRHLVEPFAALKSAAALFKAEALSAKLCHIGDEFVYEVALLHRDGKFVHVTMNAATGKFIEVRRAREPAPKT